MQPVPATHRRLPRVHMHAVLTLLVMLGVAQAGLD